MSRKKKKNKNYYRKRKKRFSLPNYTKQAIWGVLMILVAVLISLSFFGKAGVAGKTFMEWNMFLIGETIFVFPLIFILGGLILLSKKYDFELFRKNCTLFWPVILAVLLLVLGATGILAVFNSGSMNGGIIGYGLSWPFLKYFGFWATFFIFLTPIVIGGLIFWHFLRPVSKEKKKEKEEKLSQALQGKTQEGKPSIIKKIFAPRFKIRKILPSISSQTELEKKKEPEKEKGEPAKKSKVFSYEPPPIDLLAEEKDVPNSGNTKENSAVIKKTLENFGIDVSMSEVNIGPTVTQYTLKPAEGVKVSKITTLSNDLALSLASHPIRIEAPIPGRSLVGIEVPNTERATVRLRDLIGSSYFQNSSADLPIILGRNVSGVPVFADLAKMPHMLVAGATGTGKTIYLNSLILSLLYQPSTPFKSASPDNLRLILVDPKRVEFPVYKNLPHLLCPIIYTADETIGVLKWLTEEMERRFNVLSDVGARDIHSYNEKALDNGTEPLPFIILIIDEVADLMAARGRDIEAGIVRLAQMARAVGIHLVVATQRPSVEVITGLIKANITSRITFQVASQVDSRTVLDIGGAEKLLGRGDMLYLSAEVAKPKRIQGPFVSEKEVKKVVKYIKEKGLTTEIDFDLVQETHKISENRQAGIGTFFDEEEPLYEEAKRVVIEADKASSSLLQRRLRVGYARAARLIDMLEERGIVGPQDGSKPREVFGETEKTEEDSGDDDWQKI